MILGCSLTHEGTEMAEYIKAPRVGIYDGIQNRWPLLFRLH